jgi:hypothetical protein
VAGLREHRRLVEHDPPRPRTHHQDPRPQEHRLVDAVGDEEDRAPRRPPDLEQLVLQPLAGQRVEGAERLVHEDDVGVVRQHARDLAALLHATRQLVGPSVGELRQAHHVEEALAVLTALRGLDPAQLRPELDVLAHRHPRVEHGLLEDHAPVGGGPGDPLPADPDLALRRRHEAGDEAQQRGLAAAGGAGEADELAGLDGEVDAVERPDLAVGHVEGVRQLVDAHLTVVTHLAASSAGVGSTPSA